MPYYGGGESPEWDESFVFNITDQGRHVLAISVWDKLFVGDDNLIGRCEVKPRQVVQISMDKASGHLQLMDSQNQLAGHEPITVINETAKIGTESVSGDVNSTNNNTTNQIINTNVSVKEVDSYVVYRNKK
eukprot:gene12075-15364_t